MMSYSHSHSNGRRALIQFNTNYVTNVQRAPQLSMSNKNKTHL